MGLNILAGFPKNVGRPQRKPTPSWVCHLEAIPRKWWFTFNPPPGQTSKGFLCLNRHSHMDPGLLLYFLCNGVSHGTDQRTKPFGPQKALCFEFSRCVWGTLDSCGVRMSVLVGAKEKGLWRVGWDFCPPLRGFIAMEKRTHCISRTCFPN